MDDMNSNKRLRLDDGMSSSSNPRGDADAKTPQLQALQAKVEALEREKKERDAENEALKSEKKERDAENEALKSENKCLRRQVTKHEQEIYSYSVERIVKEGPPRMHECEGRKPSIVKNNIAHAQWRNYRIQEEQWKKNGRQGDPPKRLQYHEPARIVPFTVDDRTVPFTVDDITSVNVIVEDRGNLSIPSVLSLQRRSPRGLLPHNNEYDPQLYVKMVIDDQLKRRGISNEVLVVAEASMFSLRPDLLAVVYEGRVLFAVEIKNPGDIFTSEVAAGQALDDLKALKQMGQDTPLVLLSTYNQSAIVIFADMDDEYAQVLSEGSKNASSKTCEQQPQAGAVQTPARKNIPSGKPAISPSQILSEKLQRSLLKEAETDPQLKGESSDGEESDIELSVHPGNNDEGYNYRGRTVKMSPVIELNDLYSAVALIIETSLVSHYRSMQNGTQKAVPEEGAEVRRELLTLHESGFEWKTVNIDKVTYWAPPRFRKNQPFHVLAVLGQGQHGRVLLCTSSSGKVFAVKLYLIKASTHYAAKDREEEEAKFREQQKDEAQRELEMWNKFSSSAKAYCRVLTLNNITAITMPVYAQIPVGKRKDWLERIRTLLETMGTEGFVYNEVRWRHFGLRGERVHLLDYGSFRKVEEGENCQKLIAEQIESLKERMGEAPEVPHARIFV